MIDLAQARKVIELTLAEYSRIRAEYWAQLYDQMLGFLLSNDSPNAYKNKMKRAMVETFPRVADVAWVDGGSELPLDAETNQWLTDRMNAELGFIDTTFANLRLLRKAEEENAQAIAAPEAAKHADAYAKTLDGIYNQIKAMAAGSMMLTLVGQDGQPPFPCPECRKLKNKRHKASWWIGHGLVPYAGNPNYTCGNWRCNHVLVDDRGRLFTL